MTDVAQAKLETFLLTVAYDGATFHGLARQPALRTVAGELDGALRSLDPRASLVRAVSRTDTGVHALHQRVAFDSAAGIPPRGWALGVAPHLPDSVAVLRASRVSLGYDPRDHVVDKTYRYVILQSPVRDPFMQGRCWRVAERLNHALMSAEAEHLLGTHDFRAFRSSMDERLETTRTMFEVALEPSADSRAMVLRVRGDRFMHRMMRIIAGTIVDVGRGRLAPGAIARGLTTGERRVLGLTAPPEGLFLERVTLDDEGLEGWPEAD
jgi:tRNA pseudouridine38-40 synthase